MNMIKEIESKILELCSEDAYGSWELWWSVEDKKLEKSQFIDVILSLIAEDKIAALSFQEKEHRTVSLDLKKLESEIENADHVNPESSYWFETVEVGGHLQSRYMKPGGNDIVRVFRGNLNATDLVKRGDYARISDGSAKKKISEPVPLAGNPVLSLEKGRK